MKTLAIDIETYSSADLVEAGVYKYAEAPDFRILLFAYAIDGGTVEVVDLASGEELPFEVRKALTEPSVTKTAYNATFERVCIGRWLGLTLPPEQWRCTMVAAARMGLPLSLAQCGEVLGLEQGKMKEGKALIKRFSLPNRKGERNLPTDYPDEWETFKAYNKRDVEVEQAVLKVVGKLPQPSWEQRLYAADQRINDRGVLIERRLVENADRFAEEYTAELFAEAQKLTGLENPNSPAQLKQWLAEAAHCPVDSLNKKVFDDIEKQVGRYSTAYKVLQLRKEMGKTSVKKYSAMLDCVCADGRIHGLLQYYGAARTGRWAGRLVQVQNLPQNHLSDLDDARRLVLAGDLDEFSMCYAGVTQVLSELIRTAFVASPGKTFHVCDFSAIEARVIAWLAGEEWVLDVFRKNGDIYCATASKMFRVPVEKHGQNSELRAKGKIATLALGYEGGVPALVAFGADKMGMTEQDMRDTVRQWRDANPHIVRLWRIIERAAARTISTGMPTEINRGVRFWMLDKNLCVTLPSGRNLCYPDAQFTDFTNAYGKTAERITYSGTNQTTKKWERLETYGGKMTENLVQAIARDILGVVLLRAEQAGLDVVFHVHDEIIVEASEGQTLGQVEELFSRPIAWAEGLPLKGAGYSTPYYLKD